MQNKKFLFLLGILSIIIGACSHERIEEDNILMQVSYPEVKKLHEEDIEKEILPVVQNFLNAQYEYLIGRDTTPQWEVIEGGEQLKQEIDQYRTLQFNQSFQLIGYASKAWWKAGEMIPGRIGLFTQSGDSLVLYNVIDDKSLTIKGYRENWSGDRFDIEVGGIVYDEFKFVYRDGRWLIKSWKEKGALGLHPRWYSKVRESSWPAPTNPTNKLLNQG